jgi:beta-glucanase (GH16 family)
MHLHLILSAVLLLAGTQAALATPAAAGFSWPEGARAAVSLSYDDALDSQLDHALPALDRAGLKGSFYLQLSNPAVARRMAEWRAAAAHGHELGNHSLFHQCSRKAPGHEWVQAARDLDTTGVDQMREQVRLANTMLAAIDGKAERTYTVPCGDRLALGGDYLPGLADAFVAIKVGGGDGVIPDMAGLDPLAVPVLAPEGLSGKELIAIVERAGRAGSMVNFTFHGIGGDYLQTSAAAHRELVDWLAAHREEYWTDTFVNIMRHVRSRQAGWVLDWHDEFDGTKLDAGKWVAETGGHGWGNQELQYYTGRPDNLRVEDGKLVIEARREDYKGSRYTSARIKTAGLVERTYGRYEARILIPRGQGIWPAFWMLGVDAGKQGWPRSGEIDIMENIGKEPNLVHGTLHGPGYAGANAFGRPQALKEGSYADDWHVFAVEWEPGEIRWYRDGILYHTARPDNVPGGDWVFEQPFYVLLNLAVGGAWPGNPDAATVLPQRMLVDYVRVYRRTSWR